MVLRSPIPVGEVAGATVAGRVAPRQHGFNGDPPTVVGVPFSTAAEVLGISRSYLYKLLG